jgi:glycosyltransferase involved in cell wall biosynthesis
MRVVHAAGWYFPESMGGTEVYVAGVVRELRRTGLDVHVAAPLPGASNGQRYSHDDVPVFRYPIPLQPTRAEARGNVVARGAESFHQWLDDMRPDVVHFHTFVTGLDLLEIEHAKRTGAQVFVTSHSSALGYICLRGTLLRWGREACSGITDPRDCAACALQHRGVPRRFASAAAAIPLRVARLADRIDHPIGTGLGLPAFLIERAQRQRRLFEVIDGFYALTDAARAILIANGAPPASVIVNRLGVDADVVAANAGTPKRPAQAPITIGYLGRLDPIKGVEDLLRAAESLERTIPFRVVIRGAGDSEEANRLRNACHAAARRDPRITVSGPVERDAIAAELASWDLLCCPGRALEGGPTVALEAFAAGTPVIGSGFGGLAEIVSDGVNGRLFAPGDWQRLAGIIRDAALHPQQIDAWQSRIPAVRTLRDVADQYCGAYHAALRRAS